MNCIIVHGCQNSSKDETYNKHWMPWTKRKLEEKRVKTSIPLMPEAWAPDYFRYREVFDKLSVDQDSVLIGHSCGCAFLVRWLGETEKKIKKLILVAPWKISYGLGEKYEIRKKFYEYPINKNVKKNVKEIIIFTADDEEEDGKRSVRIFHETLGGKIIELKGRGHYIL